MCNSVWWYLQHFLHMGARGAWHLLAMHLRFKPFLHQETFFTMSQRCSCVTPWKLPQLPNGWFLPLPYAVQASSNYQSTVTAWDLWWWSSNGSWVSATFTRMTQIQCAAIVCRQTPTISITWTPSGNHCCTPSKSASLPCHSCHPLNYIHGSSAFECMPKVCRLVHISQVWLIVNVGLELFPKQPPAQDNALKNMNLNSW